MKKKLYTVLTLALILILSTSTVSAAGFKLSAGFKLGSLIADGYAYGLGNTDVTIQLDASGIPLITCTNQGGTQAPGQNPPKVSASGNEFLNHNDYTKNGRSAFNVETSEPQPGLSAKKMGCPSNTWTASIDFVFWTNATISMFDTATGTLLFKQDYTCVTTHNPDSITCTPVP
jgi:hypothetical protein